jgi:primosomal protein N' (replication factor Y) (superfamily II helicase)
MYVAVRTSATAPVDHPSRRTPLFVEVALPLPLHRTFAYAVPEGDRARIEPGARVLVPFRGKHRIGWVDRVAPASELTNVRELLGVLDSKPLVPPEILRLARWIARYYIAPLGVVIRTALPAALSDSSREMVSLVPGAELDEGSLTELEARLVGWLRSRDEAQPVARARRELGEHGWWPVIRRLQETGVLEVIAESPRAQPGVRTRRVLRLTREIQSLRQREELFGRAKRQRECWEIVTELGGAAHVAHLTQRLGFSSSVLAALVDKGVAEIVEEEVARDPYAGIDQPERPRLVPTADQAGVISQLVSAARSPRPGTFLLHGITGSGKTLVYIELLREVVEQQGRTAIVLVPEIALTPQTVGRFKAVFGDRVAVLHSKLSEGERYDEWRALRSGSKRIAVGARSAVFAPLPDLGAIVVDEEHETTYKQGDAPRYHARELAVVRAGMEGALCLLGSATPSLESWVNALTGKYRLLELPLRAGGQPLPPIRVVDLRAERRRERETKRAGDAPAPPASVLSTALVDAVRERLERREQSILLLNRRGYSNFVQCRECGQVWHCPNCNVSLTFHRRRARLTCHYCFHEEPSPDRCSACGSTDLSFRGVGTEQLERSVGELFPAARIARMDVDTTSGKWAHHEILDRVDRGEVDILLGTQMIAKGLDFPNVTLVGVVNADTAMNLPDFRASERTFQLLTQVAGRAGRGLAGGEVIVQTSLPNHYAVSCAVEHDFVSFADRELRARERPLYPPLCRLVNVVVSATEEVATQRAADSAAEWLRGLLSSQRIADVELVGPAPCPIDRIRGRWRWHFLLRSQSGDSLGKVMRYFAHRYQPGAGKEELRIAIDRDPVALL